MFGVGAVSVRADGILQIKDGTVYGLPATADNVHLLFGNIKQGDKVDLNGKVVVATCKDKFQ